MKRYEQFPHTSDIGVHVYGKDMHQLFENAAFAMFDVIADLENISGDKAETIELEAGDQDMLLVSWLDELLFRFYTKGLIFYKFQIELLTEYKLKAKALARPVAKNRNRLKTEIKAVTYSGLKIRKSEAGYEVEIIFDV